MVAPKQSETDPDRFHVRIVHINRVAKARSEIAPARELEHLARIYNLLGNPTRLKIVMALKSGEMCVCDLAAFTGLSDSAVSHQLRHLKNLNLVKQRRDGQILYYSLNDDHVAELLKIGLEHVRE